MSITEIEKGMLIGYLIDAPADIKKIVGKISTRKDAVQLEFLGDEAAIRLDGAISKSGLPLSNRAINCLEKYSEISSVRELICMTENDLRRLPRLGELTRNEIRKALAGAGLSLKKMSNDTNS